MKPARQSGQLHLARSSRRSAVKADILDGGGAADLCKESLAADEAAVGIGVEEARGKVGVKPGDIGFIDGSDVVAVEFPQLGAMLLVVAMGSAPCRWDDEHVKSGIYSRAYLPLSC